SLARMYAGLIGEVDGVRILGGDTVAAMSTPRTSGVDLVLGGESRFGLGMLCDSPFSPFLGPGSFGHYGAGGSVGFAHPASGVAFAYVMNQMRLGLNGDPRTDALIEAVHAVAG
ncbi:MAG TPA: serine hydrolase, partial [Acidimicrobiales bacterium]